MELLTIVALVLAVLFASLVVAVGQPTTSVADLDWSRRDLPPPDAINHLPPRRRGRGETQRETFTAKGAKTAKKRGKQT
jgi:hypothetical protein